MNRNSNQKTLQKALIFFLDHLFLLVLGKELLTCKNYNKV